MRRNSLFFLSFVFAFVIHAQLRPHLFHFRGDSAYQLKFYFGDEFSESGVNQDRWFNGYPWGGLSYVEDQWADPANAVLSDGVLSLNLKKTDELRKFPEWMIDTIVMKKLGKKLVDGKYQLKFTGSAIWSKEQFKYGYFECRCKTPSGKGLWPAFWLYGGNPNDEIDFMELKGEKSHEIHVDVHCPDNCDKGYPGPLGFKKNWGGWVKVKSDLNSDWNIVSGYWTPGSVVFYLNGIPLANFNGDFKNPMNLIANLAIAADNGPFNPGPDKKTVFPASMLVDYIRVWKTADDPVFSLRKIISFDPDDTPKPDEKMEMKNARKKPIRFMFQKKKMQTESGFLSFYPSAEKKYKLTCLGTQMNSVEILLRNLKGEVVLSQKISGVYSELDLSDYSGHFSILIKHGLNTHSFEVDL